LIVIAQPTLQPRSGVLEAGEITSSNNFGRFYSRSGILNGSAVPELVAMVVARGLESSASRKAQVAEFIPLAFHPSQALL
jgi:hypothetical protein